MNKQNSRVIALLMAVIMAFTAIPLLTVSAGAAKASIDSTGKILTISGSGKMTDYSNNMQAPYYNNKEIEKVVISNGITHIGDYYFCNMQNLKEVEFPASLKTIGKSAFYNCPGIESVTLSAVESIGDYAFYYCYGLKTVEFGNSLEKIGDYAFAQCSEIDNVVIPEPCEKIGSFAFAWCHKLTTIELPVSLKKLGDNVFNGSNNLTDIYYSGTEEQFNGIDLGAGNDNIKSILRKGRNLPQISFVKEKYETIINRDLYISGTISNYSGSGADLLWSSNSNNVVINTPASVLNTNTEEITFSIIIKAKAEGDYVVTLSTPDGITRSVDVHAFNKAYVPGFSFFEDTYSFGNISELIDRHYFVDIFGEIEGDVAYHWMEFDSHGNLNPHGHCFGFAVSCDSNFLGLPGADTYQDNHSYNNLRDININSNNSDLSMSARDFIKYCHVYQYNDTISTMRNTEEYAGFDNVYNAVYESLESGIPVAIDLWGGPGGHTVLGIGVNEGNIIVYDSNEPNGETLIRKKRNADEWTYSGGGWVWDSEDNRNPASINYIDDIISPYAVLKYNMNLDEYNSNYNYSGNTSTGKINISRNTKSSRRYIVCCTDGVILENEENLIPIKTTSGEENNKKLYWSETPEVNVLKVEKDGEKIEVAGNKTALSSTLNKGQNSEIKILDEGVTYVQKESQGQGADIEIKKLSSNGSVITTEIKGTITEDVAEISLLSDELSLEGICDISVKTKENGNEKSDKEIRGNNSKNKLIINERGEIIEDSFKGNLFIRNFVQSRNLSYRTTITFTAGTVDAPEGSSIHWFINGKDSGVTGEKYKAEGVKDDFTVQAKLIGRDGSILSESEKETVTVSNGFFARLIAFFRTLFGNLPVIEQ